MHLFIAFDKRITASEPHLKTVTYSKYAPVYVGRLFLVLHLFSAVEIKNTYICE